MIHTCTPHVDKIEEHMRKKNLTWKSLDSKHRFGHYVIKKIREQQIITPYKLIQLAKILDADYNELANTSNLSPLLLRRLYLGLTSEYVAEVVGCCDSYISCIELDKRCNETVKQKIEELYDELEEAEDDYKVTLLTSVMRYSY